MVSLDLFNTILPLRRKKVANQKAKLLNPFMILFYIIFNISRFDSVSIKKVSICNAANFHKGVLY